LAKVPFSFGETDIDAVIKHRTTFVYVIILAETSFLWQIQLISTAIERIQKPLLVVENGSFVWENFRLKLPENHEWEPRFEYIFV